MKKICVPGNAAALAEPGQRVGGVLTARRAELDVARWPAIDPSIASAVIANRW
jgi:hypothetical protein